MISYPLSLTTNFRKICQLSIEIMVYVVIRISIRFMKRNNVRNNVLRFWNLYQQYAILKKNFIMWYENKDSGIR